MALRKNKAFALPSVISTATVFGVSVFSVSASEDVIIEEEFAPAFWGLPNRWRGTLTDDQLAKLKEIIEENRAKVKEQIEAWDVEIPVQQSPMGLRGSFIVEQIDELQAMKRSFQDTVNAKLEECGEVPEESSQGFGMGSL